MPRPSHSPWFAHPNNTWSSTQVTKLHGEQREMVIHIVEATNYMYFVPLCSVLL